MTAICNNSVRDSVAEEEWKTRIDLAAFYRLVALHGMTDLVLGHLSARVPGTTDQFLLNPYPRLFEQITASTLVKVNAAGDVLLDVGYNYDIPAYTIHGAVYEARPDAGSAAHTHTTAAMAYSALPGAMLPISPKGIRFNGSLAFHSFEGIFDNPKERARLADDMGELDAVLLENHGYLVCGPTVPECWEILYDLEEATKSHLAALSTGAAIASRSQAALAKDRDRLTAERIAIREESWASQLRFLDRIDTSFRE